MITILGAIALSSILSKPIDASISWAERQFTGKQQVASANTCTYTEGTKRMETDEGKVITVPNEITVPCRELPAEVDTYEGEGNAPAAPLPQQENTSTKDKNHV